MKFASLFVIGIIFVAPLSLAAQAPPRIFFSDLDSGPNVGGQKNHSAWVTILGQGLWC
jgi:hypothetical protein